MSKKYYVYIATNDEKYILYTGVSNNIDRRIYEHKEGVGSKFTKKYSINRLVYFEEYQDVNQAKVREKQLKSGSRIKKVKLINSLNPTWKDLISLN